MASRSIVRGVALALPRVARLGRLFRGRRVFRNIMCWFGGARASVLESYRSIGVAFDVASKALLNEAAFFASDRHQQTYREIRRRSASRAAFCRQNSAGGPAQTEGETPGVG